MEQGQKYIPEQERDEWDDAYHIYDTQSKMNRIGRMHMKDINRRDLIFREAMNYLTGTESLLYQQAQTNSVQQIQMMGQARNFLSKYNDLMEYDTDVEVMLKRLESAMFRNYIIDPLIADYRVSDIKISGPNDIRARVNGKAHISNAYFLDAADMTNFIKSVGLRNGRNIEERPFTRFVDKFDENYRLRFSITMPRILQCPYPVMHIRKIPKKKPGIEELFRRGLLTPIIWEYLKDKAKTAKCVIFVGGPGSGKTTILNEWIEVLPKWEEPLCIQENDELYTDQPGWIFKTPDIYYDEEGNPQGVTMEALGQMALVEGCNRFIIGETKGAEMRNFATLINSGCKGALTAHTNSARAALPKLADLVTLGSNFSMETAKAMVSDIDVIVFLKDYRVHEILECTGYDRKTDEFKYRPIYLLSDVAT